MTNYNIILIFKMLNSQMTDKSEANKTTNYEFKLVADQSMESGESESSNKIRKSSRFEEKEQVEQESKTFRDTFKSMNAGLYQSADEDDEGSHQQIHNARG